MIGDSMMNLEQSFSEQIVAELKCMILRNENLHTSSKTPCAIAVSKLTSKTASGGDWMVANGWPATLEQPNVKLLMFNNSPIIW
jgi:hypothetical protein